MDGGSISTVAELRQRVDAKIAARSEPAFDKRPGALEATRGLSVVGVVGTHLPNGWFVGLQLGDGVSVEMPIGEARKLAADIALLCDFLEFGVPD